MHLKEPIKIDTHNFNLLIMGKKKNQIFVMQVRYIDRYK